MQLITAITNDHLSRAVSAAGHCIFNSSSGWYVDGDAAEAAAINAFVATYDPKPDALALKLEALADYRWRRETGGITVAGIAIATDDRSKLMVTGKRVEAAANPSGSWVWKTGAGQAVTLTAAQVITISDAVAAWVQTCFDRENVLATQLTALTWQEIDAFDIAASW